MRPLRVRTYVRRPPSVRSSHRTAAAVDRRFLSTTTCQGFVLQSVHVQARIYRLLRAPSSIFPPHCHRFQSRSRSRSRSHAVQATLYISTRPVCSAPLRKLHMSFRGGTGTPFLPPCFLSFFFSVEHPRQTGIRRWMDTLFLGAYRFFRAWFNVSYIYSTCHIGR